MCKTMQIGVAELYTSRGSGQTCMYSTKIQAFADCRIPKSWIHEPDLTSGTQAMFHDSINFPKKFHALQTTDEIFNHKKTPEPSSIKIVKSKDLS